MKRIAYISPIDYMRGNVSGRQTIEYTQDGGKGYDVPVGDMSSAIGYFPRLVMRYTAARSLRGFQVRTKTSVNMTAAVHRNLALMGGVGALVASLLRSKATPIYIACASAVPKGMTFRKFISPILRAGLAAKAETITVADGVQIINPWISQATPNVPVPAAVIAKFASELSV